MKQEVKTKIQKAQKEGYTVTPITSEDGKYTMYLRNPTRLEYGRFRQKYRTNDVEACEFLANTTYIAGDREIVDQDEYFFSSMDEMLGIIQIKGVSLGKPLQNLGQS